VKFVLSRNVKVPEHVEENDDISCGAEYPGHATAPLTDQASQRRLFFRVDYRTLAARDFFFAM
jgi:hypothetical protein